MAAKAGISDLIRAAKAAAQAAKPAQRGVGAMPKKAPSNVRVVPPAKSAAPKYGSPTKRYVEETGRPKVVNGRPVPKKVAPVKKAAPTKQMLPAKPTAAQMKEAQAGQIKWWQDVESQGKAPGGFKTTESRKRNPAPVQKPIPKKAAPAKKAVAATAAKKADYEKRLRPFNPMAPGSGKKPLPTKPSTPVKKFR